MTCWPGWPPPPPTGSPCSTPSWTPTSCPRCYARRPQTRCSNRSPRPPPNSAAPAATPGWPRPPADQPHHHNRPQRTTRMIDKLRAHYWFTRMPFGPHLAPGMLHRHAAHNEAVARITWCITEPTIRVITAAVGAGKTVSVRAVLTGLDTSRHTLIYLPNPLVRVRRIHEALVRATRANPTNLSSPLVHQTPRPPPPPPP